MNNQIETIMALADEYADARRTGWSQEEVQEKRAALEAALRPGSESLADKFSAMHANGDVWITTIAAAKLAMGAAPPAQTPPPRLTGDELWKFWWDRPEVPDGEDDSTEAQFVAAGRAIETAVRRQFGVNDASNGF